MSQLTVHGKLQVTGLGKSFVLHNRGGIRVSGFEQVSFSLGEGELLALSGPSGAGKSSILKTIYRTYLPGCGSILFQRKDGSVIDLATCSESRVLDLRRREIGFVTQFLKVLPRISSLDAVAQPLIELGESVEIAHARARELLTRFGIRRELFGLSPLTFSGGEQQRINIARAVIAPKELLLLDEPTASLDPESSATVLDLLRELKNRGIAMIAVFHDRAKIDAVADRVCVVARGR